MMDDNSIRRQNPVLTPSLTDHFLHSSIYADTSLLFRARVLILSQFAVMASSFIVVPFFLFGPVPAVTRQVGVPVSIIFVVVLAPLLFVLRRTGRYDFCAQATVGVLLVPIALGAFITGGMSESPVAHSLVVLPLVMAFFFGGIPLGRRVTVIVFALICSGLLLESYGLPIVQVFTAEQAQYASYAFLACGIGANAILGFLYEYVLGVARKARDQEHQRVVQLARTDPLTGLANRRAFNEILLQRINTYHTSAKPRRFCLCYLDLNGFKPINDRHGHDVGDQVLRMIAIRLQSTLRGLDDVGRQGGDEFMMVLGDMDPGLELQNMAERLLTSMAEPMETSAGLLEVTGSLGFAFCPDHGTTIDALKLAADSAMYEAKRGKVGWCICHAVPDSKST